MENLLSKLVAQAIPNHGGKLHGSHDRDNRKQFLIDYMIDNEPVLKDDAGRKRASDPHQAGGSAAVLQITFIHEFAQQGNSAQGMAHGLLSN
jgi:hypothetical protein